MPTVRAFLAVPLPPPLQEQLARLRRDLAGPLQGLRWSNPATVHLTLRFFGDTPVDDLEKICASMLSVALRERPFHVDLQGLGAFPSPSRPRVVWIGLTPAAPLQALYRDCARELASQGFPGEARAFSPHLTIGRYREHGPDLTTLLAGQIGRFVGQLPVNRLALYESRLRPEGAQHIPLFTVPLQERDDLVNHRISQEGNEHG
jgi:2'-5' RNA ligase